MATPHRPSRPTRTPTSRPRRVAGRPPAAAPAEPDDVVDVEDDDEAVDHAGVDLDKTVAAPVVVETGPDGDLPDARDRRPARRPLVALVAAIVVLLGIGVAELVYLAGDHGGDGDTAPTSAERPVQLSELTVRSVVDQAAKAADAILSASSADYDGQVEAAAATMTDAFAEEYRTTKADVKEQFVAEQTEVAIDISAQGVIKASADEVQALVFLTQSTRKGATGGVTPVQYRVTVTMVDTDTDAGWLVSDLQAL